jgi:hypothetical protein
VNLLNRTSIFLDLNELLHFISLNRIQFIWKNIPNKSRLINGISMVGLYMYIYAL